MGRVGFLSCCVSSAQTHSVSLGLTEAHVLVLVSLSLMLAEIHSFAPRLIQTPSLPHSFTQSHPDPPSFTQM